jgi:IS5 family transposase
MPALAQIQFDAEHLAYFIAIVFFLVAGLNQIMRLADRFQGRKTELAPQPLVVQSAQEWMARKDCQNLRAALVQRVSKMETEVDELRDQLREDRAALLRAGEERAIRIHQRIDALGLKLTEELGVLRGELKRMH